MNETFPANTPQPPGSGETFPDTAPGRTPAPNTCPAAAINLHSVPDPRPRLTITRRAVQSELARRSLPDFARRCVPGFCPTPFHTAYYRTLDAFAKGLVRRLIVSVPPQHGKSLGSSVLLPAYALGIRPDLRIALASYNLRLASRFNRRIQQLIDSAPYAELFPDTRLKPLHGGTGNKKEAAAPSAAVAGNLVRTAEEFDLAGQSGGLLAVGREGSLTGNTVDLLILDDLFKDALEANSPLVRDNAWEWYNAVARTRLHNGSQELIVGTRWHEEDLPGRIAAHERVVGLTDFSQLGTLPPDCWLMLNFEAIKESPPTPADPRGKGEALWPARHSRALLDARRRLDPHLFEALYQGRPASKEGLLYGEGFATYDELPATVVKRGNYTDTADTGDDYLCSLCYAVGGDGMIYLTDALYTPEPMEATEPQAAAMLRRADVREALFESNNGGRGFARAVGRLVPEVRIAWTHQSRNKEARILSNSATVQRLVRWPRGWEARWPELARDLLGYRRLYRANRRHDAPDALTGVVETELDRSRRTIRAVVFRSPER